MFCDRCGTPLQPDYNVCPKCGSPIIRPGAPPLAGRLEKHLHILGVLWIVIGALWLLPSFFLLTMGHAMPFMFPGMFPGRMFGHVFFPPLMFGVGAFFLLIAAGGICVGWGLMRHEPWARVAGIILGVLAVFHPPIGTLLGIYTLWVLLSHDAAAYDRLAGTR